MLLGFVGSGSIYICIYISPRAPNEAKQRRATGRRADGAPSGARLNPLSVLHPAARSRSKGRRVQRHPHAQRYLPRPAASEPLSGCVTRSKPAAPLVLTRPSATVQRAAVHWHRRFKWKADPQAQSRLS